MAIVYGILLVVAIALLILYCALIDKKERWLLVLYSSVCVVNLGYLLLSLSKNVEFALWANKLVYLGHIFTLTSMFLTIVKLCGFHYNKYLSISLVVIGIVMFAMVCTTGYLPWYYKEVTLEQVDGAAKLVKKYGPLHVVYLIYILTVFILTIVAIIWSITTKKVNSSKQAGLLSAVVLYNIAMWIIEKFVTWNFEFLSLSYILSEGMLFFLYWLIQDYVHKTEVSPQETTRVVFVDSISTAEKMERVLAHLPADKKLTVRQMEMLEGILEGKTRKEIAVEKHISENTVKMHTAILYEVLGVSGKEEIFSLVYTK